MVRRPAHEGHLPNAAFERPALAVVLAVSALLVLVSVVLWLALLVPTTPAGTVAQQLASLEAGMAGYRWAFVNAAVINPAFVVMLVAATLLLVTGPLRPHEAAGLVFVLGYWPLPTLAYLAQVALLPRLLGSVHAELWYFGNAASVAYWLALCGYGLLGIGAILLASRFLRGGARPFGWVLLASGVASAAGLVGYGLDVGTLELGSTIGGALAVPLAVIALVGARRAKTGR